MFKNKLLNHTFPVPGSIFREYKWNGPWKIIDCPYDKWQRVTEQEPRHPGALKYLPNPVNNIEISDLKDAVGAEICIEAWGGHAGTSNKRIRINGNEWIPVPESELMGPGHPEGYQYFRYPVIPVPLEQLKEGINSFECACGSQVCYDFGWGQWGIYGLTFRIYYKETKPHPTGKIISPLQGSTISGTVFVAAEASKAESSIDRVDFLGYYEDFDHNGDGIYEEWHYSYRYGEIRHNLGTALSYPFKILWDTSRIPDQSKPIKIMCIITDYTGISYITPAVEDIIFKRTDNSIKIYKPYDVPGAWQTRNGQIHSCKVNVCDNLKDAIDAWIIMTTWNGMEADEIGINGVKIIDRVGRDHDYSYDEIPVPLHLINNGVNEFYTKAFTEHHGIEVLWPGIVLKIRYALKEK